MAAETDPGKSPYCIDFDQETGLCNNTGVVILQGRRFYPPSSLAVNSRTKESRVCGPAKTSNLFGEKAEKRDPIIKERMPRLLLQQRDCQSRFENIIEELSK